MMLKNRFFTVVVFFAALLVSGLSFSEELKLDIPPQVKETAQNNMNYLMNQTIVKAKEKLKEGKGEIYPFGAGLFGGGKVRYIWVGTDKDKANNPPPQAALHGVRRTLQANAVSGAIVGSAVYYVLAELKDDGEMDSKLIVELEHLPGIAIARGIKFSVDDSGEIIYGASGEQEFDSKVFVVEDAPLENVKDE